MENQLTTSPGEAQDRGGRHRPHAAAVAASRALVARLGVRQGVVAALLTLALLPSCSKEPEPARLLADARQFQQKGDNKSAIIQLKNLLVMQPKHAEARYLLGLSYRQLNAQHSAEKEFREALAAGYDKKAVLPLLAEALFKQGEFQKLLDQTRSSDHGEAALTAPILSMRGHAQLSLGDPESAAESFEGALKRQPQYADALLGQYRLAVMERQEAKAGALLAQALAADKTNQDAWMLKGDWERAHDRLPEAIAAYRQTYELAPGNVPANLNLASAYMASGKFDDAKRHIDNLMRIAPDNPLTYYLLGLIEFKKQDYASAFDSVQKALKNAPKYLPATALAGAVAFATGDDTQAEQQLQRALDSYPDNLYLRKLLASTLIKRQKYQKALELLESARLQAPEDSTLLALMAEAFFQKRDMVNAQHYFELATQHHPTDTQLKTGLALTYLIEGKNERALADLETAGETGGARTDILLASSLLAAGQADKALTVIDRLEKTQARQSLIHNLRGAALLTKHDIAGARAAFERALSAQPGYLPAALNLAQLDARQGDIKSARSRLTKVIEASPGNADAMFALADLETAAGRHDEAILWLERARQKQPAAFRPVFALGRLYFARGDSAKAIPMLQKALQISPENAEALNMLGYAQMTGGQLPESLTTYSRLVTLYPRSAQALYGLSTVQSASGNLAGAAITLQKALELQPDFPEAISALSRIRLTEGKTDEVLRLASRAQQQLPRHPVGYLAEGDARMQLKRYTLAAQAYQTAFDKQPGAASLMKLHSALRADGRSKEGVAKLQGWLATHPNDSQIRLYLADASIKEQNCPAAIEQYQVVLKQQADNLAILHNLGWCYQIAGDPRALDIAERAYQIAPHNAGTLYDLARLLLDKGDVKRALGLLQSAAEEQPDSKELRYQLVQAYLRNGDKGMARVELDRLLRSSGEFAQQAEAEALLKQLKN